LLIHSNAPIELKNNAKVVREAVSQLINVSDERVIKLFRDQKWFRFNTLASFDELNIILLSFLELQMISVTYVSDSTRDAANKVRRCYPNMLLSFPE